MGTKVDVNCKVNPVKVPLETDQGILESEERKWGMPLKDVYKYGLAFYKDKEGKALLLSYEDRLKLVAYTQQTVHGPLDLNSVSPLGVLDVIGRDRRAAWQALGQMSQIQAMAGFVHTLDRLCPLFRPYLEAIQKDLQAKKQQELKKELEEQSRQELQERVMLEKQKQQSNKPSEETQVQRIKEALNAQTYEQFLAYAQQQFPGNFDQQALLIRQLQDQHYQQYIQQLTIDKRLANCSIRDEDHDTSDTTGTLTAGKDCNLNDTITDVDNKAMQTSEKSDINAEYTEESRGEESDGDVPTAKTISISTPQTKKERKTPCGGSDNVFPHIEEARMWTSPDIVKFKETARASGGTLTVGHGETVTVRVPTHPRASCICWEFATDNYDIGFGVYFEWSKSSTTEVTVHVSDSDEELEDADDDEVELEARKRGDPELGAEADEAPAPGPGPAPARPPLSPVVTLYRRDTHLEVYAGSHTYPGEGVYLLKFDNTYSLWRSKTLYYKVYYTQFKATEKYLIYSKIAMEETKKKL